jgi:hypothetical protein
MASEALKLLGGNIANPRQWDKPQISQSFSVCWTGAEFIAADRASQEGHPSRGGESEKVRI